jgi:hypothetical protein
MTDEERARAAIAAARSEWRGESPLDGWGSPSLSNTLVLTRITAAITEARLAAIEECACWHEAAAARFRIHGSVRSQQRADYHEASAEGLRLLAIAPPGDQ